MIIITILNKLVKNYFKKKICTKVLIKGYYDVIICVQISVIFHVDLLLKT